MKLDKLLITFFICLITNIASAQNISEVQQVMSSCTWKPPTPKALNEINKPLPSFKELQEINQDISNQDRMIISEKSRKYFYSLPNINCRSEIFIVRKDTILWLDSYKDGNDEYIKAAYFSQSLKKIIIGWIPSQGVCQYEPSQSLKVRCGI